MKWVGNLRRKQILRINALEAWAQAIRSCNDIVSGKATLQYKKQFVSSLHNAVELFFKQYMINLGNHDVLTLRGKQSTETKAQAYFSATDLNEFFESEETWCSNKNSIHFSQIIKQYRTWFLADGALQKYDFTKELILLNQLRNQETHFFVNHSYLSDKEFECLYNFMIDFFAFLSTDRLLPYWGEAFGRHERLAFKRKKLSGFTYKQTLKNSSFVRELAAYLGEKEYIGPTGDSFDIAQTIAEESDGKYKVNELWTYIEMLINHEMLSWTETIDEFEDEEGRLQGNVWINYCIDLQ